MKTEIIEQKSLVSEFGDFLIRLWKQGKYYYVTIEAQDPRTRAFQAGLSPAKFRTLSNARKAFDKVHIRSDGFAVFGHTWKLEA